MNFKIFWNVFWKFITLDSTLTPIQFALSCFKTQNQGFWEKLDEIPKLFAFISVQTVPQPKQQ